MKHFLPAILTLLGALGALAAACSSNNASGPITPPSSNEDAGGGPSPQADGGDGDASGDAAVSPPQGFLRIAHLSPDLPPVDVCVAPHGTTSFLGPLIGQLAASLETDGGPADASLPGLGYAQVSAYVPLSPGQYDVRIVGAGAADCSTSIAQAHPFGASDDGGEEDAALSDAAAAGDDAGLDASSPIDGAAEAGTDASTSLEAGVDGGAQGGPPDGTNLPPVAFNTHSTLLIAGDMAPAGTDPGLTLTVLPDDAALAGGAAVLRAINAIPSAPSLDFGLGSPSTQWLPILPSVAFAAASTQPAPGYGVLDSHGYLPIAPLSAQAMAARASGSDAGAALASAASVEIDLGSIATVIAIGGKTGDASNPPALLLCIDNQPSGGLLSDCSLAH